MGTAGGLDGSWGGKNEVSGAVGGIGASTGTGPFFPAGGAGGDRRIS